MGIAGQRLSLPMVLLQGFPGVCVHSPREGCVQTLGWFLQGRLVFPKP